MIEELLRCPVEHDCYDELMGWADRVGSYPSDEITDELLAECKDFNNTALANTPFSHRVHPPNTHRLDPLPVQMPPKGFEPRGLEDILRPWAIRYWNDWWDDVACILERMCDWSQEKEDLGEVPVFKMKRAWCCIIGESGFIPRRMEYIGTCITKSME